MISPSRLRAGPGCAGLVTMDLAAGGAGHDSDGLAVDNEPEPVILSGR
jgi:hypothetical protein